MGTGSEYEHEAFLSMWLSRSVFPGTCFSNCNFSVALAPAVLASIYKDMGLLRRSMAASTQMEDSHNFLVLTLWFPLCYVQVWAWERLPTLHSRPNFMNLGELRLARWEGLKKSDIGNVRPVIDYAGETFIWQPYALAVDN
ncbi:Aminotransferase-like [Forsythia ovata]|uniref:Aminotransferase-like n=1 Tax=Forsythia ovata TaxID=205694 RepID=A0ABD1Q9T7_9LAMI